MALFYQALVPNNKILAPYRLSSLIFSAIINK
jgi:hypothetical protein